MVRKNFEALPDCSLCLLSSAALGVQSFRLFGNLFAVADCGVRETLKYWQLAQTGQAEACWRNMANASLAESSGQDLRDMCRLGLWFLLRKLCSVTRKAQNGIYKAQKRQSSVRVETQAIVCKRSGKPLLLACIALPIPVKVNGGLRAIPKTFWDAYAITPQSVT